MGISNSSVDLARLDVTLYHIEKRFYQSLKKHMNLKGCPTQEKTYVF